MSEDTAAGPPPKQIVLFAVGSPLVVDYEETCARLGIAIAASVSNIDVASMTTGPERPIKPAELTIDLTALQAICPLFTPANRMLAVTDARRAGFSQFAVLIDPTCIIASTITVGTGTFLNAGCIVGGHTCIGDNVILNRGVNVGHHVRIGDFASLGPGVIAAGGVTVSESAMIGVASVLMPGVMIGKGARVAAGSVVRHDVADREVVAGNPAMPVKQRGTVS